MRNKLKILLREGLLNEANPMKIANKFGIDSDVMGFLIEKYGKKHSIIALKIWVMFNYGMSGADVTIPYSRGVGNAGIPMASAFNPEILKGYKSEIALDTWSELNGLKDDFDRITLSDIMDLIKTPNTPHIDLKKIDFDTLYGYIIKYKYISDWANNPNVETPNLTQMTWDEAEQASREWHEELKSSGAIGNEDGKKIHIFEDGYYWFDNGPGPCVDEGDAAAHCGIPYKPNMHMISLRKNRKPAVTLDWDPDTKLVVQFEGNAGTKPKSKYHPYIKWFISDPDRVKKLSPELSHKPYINFRLGDLTDSEIDNVIKLNPNLLNGLHFTDMSDNLKGKQIEKMMGMDRVILTDEEYDYIPDDLKKKYIDLSFERYHFNNGKFDNSSSDVKLYYLTKLVEIGDMIPNEYWGYLPDDLKRKYINDKLSDNQLLNQAQHDSAISLGIT